jgi:opacity protein-like surface antigen
MKKIATVAMIVCLLAIASKSSAAQYKSENLNFRISAGGGLALNLGTEENGKSEDVANSNVFTARLGYSPWKYIEFQAESSQQLSGFKKDLSLPGQTKSEMIRFIACTANLKILLPLKIKNFSFSPYAVGGVGSVYFAQNIALGKIDATKQQINEYNSIFCYGTCFKMGAGIDMFLSKNLFLFSEFSYWKNDLEIKFSDKTSIQLHPYYSTAVLGIGSKF